MRQAFGFVVFCCRIAHNAPVRLSEPFCLLMWIVYPSIFPAVCGASTVLIWHMNRIRRRTGKNTVLSGYPGAGSFPKLRNYSDASSL